jgi:hypothetical protein
VTSSLFIGKLEVMICIPLLPHLKPLRRNYLFILIGFSQQMRWVVSAQPQAVSTVTARPQTPQVYLFPSFIPVAFFAVFLATVFLETVLIVAFLVAVFFDIFAFVISFPFLFNVLPPKGDLI